MQLFHPTTIADAVGLLAAHDEARCLAGGQTLVAMLNLGLLDPPALVSLRKVDGLDRLTRHADGSVAMGATVTQAALAAAALPDALAVLSEAAQQVAHPAIRNFGTVGGALCHADPAADLPPAFVAAQARLTALGPRTAQRSLRAEDFFVDYLTTALDDREILTAIHLPPPPAGSAGAYLKYARVDGDYATVSVAATLILVAGRLPGRPDRARQLRRPAAAPGRRRCGAGRYDARQRRRCACRRAAAGGRRAACRHARFRRLPPPHHPRSGRPGGRCRARQGGGRNMRGAASVSLTVNGDPLALLAGPGATLLDMLRSQAQLTGSKQGCNSGVCGACTALVDGKTARSLPDTGRRLRRAQLVVTVEGLDDDPHAVFLREEMAAAGAVQCGYCTPGIVVALTDLFRNAAAPPDAASPAPMPGRQYLPLHRLCQHRRGRACAPGRRSVGAGCGSWPRQTS